MNSARIWQRAKRTAALGLLLCLATEPRAAAGPASLRLLVQPPSLELRGAGAEHGLVVSARAEDGRLVDVTRQALFTSRQPDRLLVSSNGTCRAVADGSAEILIQFGRWSQVVTAAVVGTAQPRPVSFRQDIEPVLTRAGCNAGPCHGKLAGQNGFKLSLRGYAPELDHAWLTSDVAGRRVNPAAPDDSLLVLKALGAVPHEGRARFPEGSNYHQTLVSWIAARCPGPDTNETDLARLEILPGDRILLPGENQTLLVRGHYRDGQVRDVTWLAQFFSNDENTATVTPDGQIHALRPGETSIRAHFQGLVEVLTVTIPSTNRVPRRAFVKSGHPIDTAVFEKLKLLGLPPSGDCGDATFLRRVSLDLTGTLPTREQIRQFEADRRKDKRARLVEALLSSPEFVDYWALQLADLLQNRRERDHDVRGAKGVRAFHAWLRGEVAANRPWDQLARSILTAQGSVADHPELGWFVYNVGEKSRIEESDTPDAAAQAFLGTRIGCARCHNHPLEKYTQDDFYHFAAFFSKVQMKRTEPDKGATTLKVGTREEEEQHKRLEEAEKGFTDATNALAQAGASTATDPLRRKVAEQQKRLDEARLQMQKVAARMPTVTQPRTKQAMAPQSLDRRQPPLAPGDDPRARLAEWMTEPGNPQFSGAMVNRLWKHFMGTGLVEPVDDLRASNPPSNPALWRRLNAEFVAHGYDLRQLMRFIVTSGAYQLSSATRPGNETDRCFYSHYQARRLPAEVLLDGIAQATGVPDEFKGYPVGTRAVQLPEPGVSSYFLTLFGRSDRVTACACERNGEVTLPQLLHLQNGDATTKKLQSPDSRLAALLQAKPKDDAGVIDELYLATLCRRPTAAERTAVRQVLGKPDKREDALRDLFWALLNSKEFAFNH